jgi:hypothetical protein
MLAKLRQHLIHEAWRYGQRPWYGSLGVSAALHIAAIALLASIWLAPAAANLFAPVESSWSPPSEDDGQALFVTDGSLVPRSTEMPEDTQGGGKLSPVKLADEDRVSYQLKEPKIAGSAPGAGDLATGGDPLAVVGELPGGGGSRGEGGGGHGTGSGHGDGAGSGFFGTGSTAQSVVFVVDASSSMNTSHDSEAKTRFGKLKLELLHSIRRMNKDLSFFIFFFNNDAIPMPADSLQPATPEAQKKYLEWVASMRAGGSTDPRTALVAALKLRPDVIYLLTDGDFDPLIRRDLRKLKQKDVVINTIGFGSDSKKAENILKTVASANRGTYHFVP